MGFYNLRQSWLFFAFIESLMGEKNRRLLFCFLISHLLGARGRRAYNIPKLFLSPYEYLISLSKKKKKNLIFSFNCYFLSGFIWMGNDFLNSSGMELTRRKKQTRSKLNWRVIFLSDWLFLKQNIERERGVSEIGVKLLRSAMMMMMWREHFQSREQFNRLSIHVRGREKWKKKKNLLFCF